MNQTIKVIDLFAGVGGIRLGLERAAAKLDKKVECVYTSEIDKYAGQTYAKNFPGDSHHPINDITRLDERDLLDFDVLLAGFPCQAFSMAGKRGGFEDTRGTLFFDVARIIKEKRPAAFLLENVKGLVSHKSGKTLATIMNVLENDLGYNVRFKILNAKHYGVPQNRERIYIVGFRDGGEGFSYPDRDSVDASISDILEGNPVDPGFYVSQKAMIGLQAHRDRHQSKGNGFGYEVKDLSGIANTIVVGGMGRERNLVIDERIDLASCGKEINPDLIRRMTPLEWERLQGFPDGWTEGVSNTQRYKQMGNSVAVPVIEAVSDVILEELFRNKTL